MTTVFAKTQKGQEEIDQRGGALGPRARRLLILFDGKRDIDALRAMMPDPKFDETVELLVAGGFVAAPDAQAANEPMLGEGKAASTGVVTSSQAVDNGPEVEPAKLEMARNFMLNSLRHFNGPYANIDLREQILRSTSGSQLRSLMEPWRESIILTKMGQLRSEELRQQLGELLL